jgi:uncharacterized delta-60 repeat protein
MKTRLTTLVLAGMFLGLAACGGGGDETTPPPAPSPSPSPPPPPGTVIGAAGGTVTGPNGAKVVIPAGALSSETRINIEVVSTGVPALPAGYASKGQVFAFTPHGTTFAQPVTVTIPFDPAVVTTAHAPGFYKTNAQNQWGRIPNAVFDADSVSAQVTSFSFMDVLDPRLLIGNPTYEYEVLELKGEALEVVETIQSDPLQGGLARHHDFGAAQRDAEVFSFDGTLIVPSDNIATAQVAATPDGDDWWVGVDSPLGITGVPTDTVGLWAAFKHTQSFVKREPDATLSFFITSAFMQTSDANGLLDRGCPRAHLVGILCDMIGAEVLIDVTGFTVPATPFVDFKTFYKLSGTAALTGIAGSWHSEASTAPFSHHKLWSIDEFDFSIEEIDGAPEALITVDLAHPIFHEYDVDLSSIAVNQAFTVQFFATTKAYNRAASSVNNVGPEAETSARAYLRDPRAPRGMRMSAAGLEAIDTPEGVEPPPLVPVVPAPCEPGPGPDPAAGTIQFDAPGYRQSESNVAPQVRVTRLGGTRGAVTATIRTSDGSAVAGVDYDALAVSVFFADGDDEPRTVTVHAIQDAAFSEPDETVNLTLSEPGGCAALGAQTTAVLTIQDDDEPPPPPSFTVGGTVSGLEGTGLTLRDQQFLTLTPGNGPFTLSLPVQSGSPYEVTITAQPSNPVQVCTIQNGSGIMGNAPVTNIRVTCVTPAPPGGLDTGFGGGTGMVTSTFGGDETDMLLQPDGKIIMVGGSSTDFVMARYNADGTLDSGFGGGDGLVTIDIAGGADAAFGAALLADGRIIVVGSARVGSNDDFAVVRYEADGDVDTTFGTLGKTTTDFFGQRDRAFGVAVFPDNSIVVVGDANVPAANADFAVARYDANGVLDATFGGAGTGKVTTDIAGGVDIAKNVLIESDGNILVTGPTTIGTSSALGHAGLARYTPAGILNDSLGTDGTLSLAGMSLGEGLAVQSDGKILVAGNASVAGDIHFAVMRLEKGGAPDGSFSSMGLATAGFTTQDDFGRDVTVDSAGRILVSGEASNRANPDFAVARFTPAGVLDAAFDDDGKFTVDFFGSFDGAENVAVQADGKILLGGFAANGNTVRYGLARFVP